MIWKSSHHHLHHLNQSLNNLTKTTPNTIYGALSVLSGLVCIAANAAEVQPKASIKVREFSLTDVKLLAGPSKHAEDLNDKDT
jgi:hypothetical protein